MEHGVLDTKERLGITCRKLNQLFESLSEGDWPRDRHPFMVTDHPDVGPLIVLRANSEWDVATVLEKVLDKELPVTKRDIERKNAGYGVPSREKTTVFRRSGTAFVAVQVPVTGDPTHPYID